MNNNMTPTPWKVAKFKSWSTNVVGQGESNDICEMSGTHPKATQNENAKAIVSAVNSTYGNGINPEAVKEMYAAVLALNDYAEYVAAKNEMEEVPLLFDDWQHANKAAWDDRFKRPDHFITLSEAKAAIDKALIK
jgi:hypothetical protein